MHVYLSCVDTLQYIYIRNIEQGSFKRVNLTIFPTCVSMSQGSDLWAVGTKRGTLVFKGENTETPTNFNQGQNVVSVAFRSNKMLVSGTSEMMMFEV